jgi:ClpP class serine protease
MKSNRIIDTIIVSSNWHIDVQWGTQQLNQYLAELNAIESGVTINYSERRKALNSATVQINSDNDISSSNNEEQFIAHHKLSGVMRLGDGLSSRGVNSLIDSMRFYDGQSNVYGHILEIDSGGGQSTAGQAMLNAVRDLKKPIYVYGHYVGSAAVMASIAADKIFLSGNQSRIGSIGSYVSINKKMAEYFKENMEDIYSEHSSDKNKEWRAYLKGDKKPLINFANESAKAFMDDVEQYRSLNESQKESTLRGGMFTAKSGVERGLADGIATFGEVVNKLSQNINQSQNHSTMNLNDFLSGVRTQVNRIFGWSLAEDTSAETMLGQLAEASTIEATIAAKVSEKLDVFNNQLTDMKTKMQGLETNAQTADEELTSLKDQLAQLQSEKETWNTEKTNLEQQLAELKSGTPIESEDAPDVGGTLATFQKQLGSISVEGESKF